MKHKSSSFASPAALLTSLLLGCPACSTPAAPPVVVAPPASTPAAVPAGAGQCPSLRGFRVAANDDEVKRGSKRWLLHEVLIQSPKVPFDGESDERSIPEPQAGAFGASTSDAPVWILSSDAAPCQMKPAGFVLQRINTGPRFERVARVLEGSCADPGGGFQAIAFQQADEPSRCRFSRVGDMGPVDLPAGLVPVKPCAPPGCRYDTRRSGGTVAGGATALSVIATWLHPTKEPECNWAHEDFYGVFVRTQAGGPMVVVPDLQLAGALTDDRGLVAVVGEAQSTMTVVPISPGGKPEAQIAVMTHLAHPEDKEHNSLAPHCGP